MFPLALSGLLGLLVSACSREDMPDNGSRDKNRGLTVSMTVAPATNGIGTKTASTTTPLLGENTYDNVCMLIYRGGAEAKDSDQPELVRKGVADQGTFTVDDGQLYLHNGSQHEVYIIAGQPDGTQPPNQNTTKGELLALTGGLPASSSDNPKLLFTGKAEFTYNYVEGAGGTTVPISLHRTVARADIALTNLEEGRTAKLYVYDMADKASYWSDYKVPENGYSKKLLAASAVNNAVYRVYLNENYTQEGSRKAAIYVVTSAADGSDVKSYEPALINGGAIARNNVYELSVTLKDNTGGGTGDDPAGTLEITSGISWKDQQEVTGDIGGTYLNVSQSKVQVSADEAITTTVTCESDGPVDIFYLVSTGTTEAPEITETVDGTNLPSWLQGGISVAYGDGVITLTIASQAKTSTEKVTVRLRTGNIIKDIEIQ